ncbi:tyrosine-type recombinase/integrase [Brevibacterium sp. 5221]|uniref:Tyrosine-type recombinase/integrase n=1 Tax=Brevibacterium rongguiense TaxID=2695267 RepID=A0A6N9H8N6_9MICO|nr:tyrosine-type recombinase/integrase [Brevibacterium rongguiense]MYM20379.1 tyrosine-type recombinase/integrase [Brevibacterium rongguiense]
MVLRPVPSLLATPLVASPLDADDFEQELIDQYALAQAAAGISDGYITSSRSVVFDFAQSLSGPIWSAGYADGDNFLAEQRRLGRAQSTRASKAGMIAQFYDFLIARYLGEIRAATGIVVEQPIDEWNRPSGVSLGKVRVPPSDAEVAEFFECWRLSIADARKYLPAARDYFAASLWRRVGLRISESVMLDIRDWRPDLGQIGKLHVRFGKGSRGRGYKPRLIPAINGAAELIDWWLAEVRPLFGSDWSNPDAPMLPSERIDRNLDRPLRVGPNALRRALADETEKWLPAWAGRMTPHVLRHYCASSLYGAGMDLKALQELLGHNWLSTTSQYIHVRGEHIENAWLQANARIEQRLGGDD